MVVACIGLAIALSGASYAAVTLPRNSVGTAQLKSNAVVSSKVKDRSLKKVDFALGQLPAGATGATGATGPAGSFSGTTVVFANNSVAASSIADGAVSCPGTHPRVTGGGFLINDLDQAFATVLSSRPNAAGNGWATRVRNGGSSNAIPYVVYAVCVA